MVITGDHGIGVTSTYLDLDLNLKLFFLSEINLTKNKFL